MCFNLAGTALSTHSCNDCEGNDCEGNDCEGNDCEGKCHWLFVLLGT